MITAYLLNENVLIMDVTDFSDFDRYMVFQTGHLCLMGLNYEISTDAPPNDRVYIPFEMGKFWDGRPGWFAVDVGGSIGWTLQECQRKMHSQQDTADANV